MADIIQIRRDTAANWGTADPVLAQGEFAWAFDTNTLKLGDGITIYSLLPTFSGSIEIQDDGTLVVTSMAINFTGNVVVTDVGGIATVNIPAAPGAPVDSVFGRTGTVIAQAGDYTATLVAYSNTTSGLTATTTQAAIDEVEGRVDALEALPAAPVDSVFGRTGAVIAQAGDYTAGQTSFDDTGLSITSSDVQDAIVQILARVGVFESFNTDTTTSLNTAGLTQVPIFGTVTQAGPSGYFTVVGNLLTVNVAMRVKVSANVSITANNTRVNIAIGASLNGTITGATGRGGYIRNNNGHNESSVHMSTILDCVIGDQIGLFSQQQAANGATTMIAARSNYIVEIVELL